MRSPARQMSTTIGRTSAASVMLAQELLVQPSTSILPSERASALRNAAGIVMPISTRSRRAAGDSIDTQSSPKRMNASPLLSALFSVSKSRGPTCESCMAEARD